MQYALALAGLAAAVSGAAVLTERQSDKCCFGINVSGNGVNGALGQLSDGQNRVGPAQSPSPAQYCINGGSITDGSGRGCILTQPTTQFQCDTGATPSPGFAIGPNGQITHNGSPTFYACPADDNGDYNIYTQPVANMPKCVEVTLTSANGACTASSAASSKVPASSALPPVTGKPPVSNSPGSSVSTKVETSSVQIVSTQPIISPTTKVETTPVPVVSTQPVYKTETEYKTIVSTSQCPAPTPAQTITQTHVETSTVTDVKTNVVTSTVQSQCPAPQTVTITSVNTVIPPPVVKTSVVSPQQSIKTSVETPAFVSSPQPSTQTSVVTSVVQQTATKSGQASSASPSAPSGGNSQGSGQGNGQCPLNLPDMSAYQYPHLIVPVDSKSPNTPGGTSYNGQVSSSTSSIFNFDIPGSYAGKTCKVIFSLPKASQLTTSSFTSSPAEGGSLDLSSLKSPASKDTSSANKPAVASDLGKINVAPGNAYTVATGPCAAGTTQSYEIASANGYSLEWFQDYNPCPIGLYVVTV